MNINFVGNRKFFYGVSIILIIVAFVSFFTKGFEQDIEFKGGTVIDVSLNQEVNNTDIENIVKELMENYGYKEIRVPVFEHTELFQRGVGDTTDVVQKEMYTFEDKGGRSITLRPEGTAGTVRCFLENNL